MSENQQSTATNENNDFTPFKLDNVGVIRNSDGTIAKGSASLNPTGRPPGAMMWQRFADRASYLMEKHSVGSLAQLYQNKAALAELPFLDAAILARMVNAINRDGGRDFDRLFDRVIGKPLQRQELTGNDGSDLFKTEDAKAALRRKLLSPAADL